MLELYHILIYSKIYYYSFTIKYVLLRDLSYLMNYVLLGR